MTETHNPRFNQLVADLFLKPLSDITADDVRSLVVNRIAESEQLEFKERLYDKDKPDRWLEDCKITEGARNKILKEVVAFANTFGGRLVLGIEEAAGEPPTAADILPISDCTRLARQLAQSVQASVEPQLPLLNVVGIPTNSDGSGVVVIDVERSYRAPHRCPDLQSYTRRGTDSEPLTMREIQDLTIRVDRGTARFSETMAASRRDFCDWAEVGAGSPNIALRFSLVPVWPIEIPRFSANSNAIPRLSEHEFRVGGHTRKSDPFLLHRQRPIVRGWQRTFDEDGQRVQQQARQDGTAHIWIWLKMYRDESDILSQIELIGPFCDALKLADAMRIAAGSPTAEYVLEWEIVVGMDRWTLSEFANSGYQLTQYHLPTKSFPSLRIGPREEWNRLLEQFLEDLLNSVGADLDSGGCEIL